jgi:hypothetical protein
MGSQMAISLSALGAGRSLPPRKIPGTYFCQRLSRPRGHNAAGRIRSIEKSNDLIGIRSRDLPACSIVRVLLCSTMCKMEVSIYQKVFQGYEPITEDHVTEKSETAMRLSLPHIIISLRNLTR